MRLPAQPFCAPGFAQAQGPGFQVVVDGPALELRFRGIPLKSVRADDNQNALSLDLNQPVDPAIFDNLARQLPQWVGIAYTTYDNGVIRATRPVTFLTRQETRLFLAADAAAQRRRARAHGARAGFAASHARPHGPGTGDGALSATASAAARLSAAGLSAAAAGETAAARSFRAL